MKTPEQILESNNVRIFGSQQKRIIDAMKEHSKQWIKEALKHEPDSYIEYYLKQIDQQ